MLYTLKQNTFWKKQSRVTLQWILSNTKGSEIQSLSIPRAAKPEIILQTLRAQTSQHTLGSGGEESEWTLWKTSSVWYTGHPVSQSVYSFPSPKWCTDRLVYTGQNSAALFVSEKCSQMVQGQETLWIPGKEKQSCRAVLFTKA